MIPLRHLYSDGLRAGRIDIWTSSLFYGFYEHGDGQMGMFHPFHLLIYRLIPFVQAFGLELSINYLALWVGSYLLFYRWTKDRIGAAFGAFVFAFAGSNAPAIVHVNRVAVIAHIPWMIYVLDRFIRCEVRNAGYWWAAIALLNGSAILLGHPFSFELSLLLQAWYVLYLLTEKASIPRAVSAACGVTVGLLVGAIQSIPTWAFLHLSSRAHPSLVFIAAGYLHPANVLQWANPYFFVGRAVGGGAQEMSIYTGVGPLLLFLWLCTQKQGRGGRLQVFLLILALIGLFLSFGKFNHLFALYSRLPGLSIFRDPSRFSLLTHFAVAGGSALALKQLRTNPASASSRLFGLLVTCWFALSLFTVAIEKFSLPLLVQYGRVVNSESHILAGCAIVCTGIVLFMFALRLRGWWLSVFCIFALCDISFYAGNFLLGLPVGGLNYYEAQRVPVQPSATVVTMGNSDDRLTLGGYRLANGYAGLMPPTIDSLKDPNYLQALGVSAVQDESGKWTTLTLPPSPPVRFEQPFFSADPIDAMEHVDLAKVAVLAQGVRVDASATGSVKIEDERPGFTRIAAESTGRMFCVLVQRFHPGWTASMDGQKLDLVPTDGDLTGFVFPGGKQTITLEFHPWDLALGRDITLVGLLLLAFGFFAQQRIGRGGLIDTE
jgi:hypothetical protein